MSLGDTIDRVFPLATYRKYQKETIAKIISYWASGKKYVVLQAPTGTGKSVVGYTAAQVYLDLFGVPKEKDSPASTAIVHTRALQAQYGKSLQLPLLWSSRHYDCALMPGEGLHFGDIQCSGPTCLVYDQCDYANAKTRYKNAMVGCTNVSYFINADTILPQVLVCDEAHKLEHILCDQFSFKINLKEWKRHITTLRTNKVGNWRAADLWLNIQELFYIDATVDEWLTPSLLKIINQIYRFVTEFSLELASYMEILKADFNPRAMSSAKKQQYRDLSSATAFLKEIERPLYSFRSNPLDYVPLKIVKDEEEITVFKPLHAQAFSLPFFGRTNRVLLMSATILGHDVFTKNLGIDEKDYAYIEVPSTFPKENRPIHVMTNLGAFTFKTRDTVLPKFAAVIDRIIDTQFKDVRGIIHSVSFENADFIVKNSRHAHRMIVPQTEDLLEIEELMRKNNNTILVGPSLVEGLDLKDSLSRFIIWLKVPYLSLGDRWVTTRMNENQDWYIREAALQFVQGSGRSMRHEEDHCVTITIDDMFSELLRSGKRFLPDWFMEAIK